METNLSPTPILVFFGTKGGGLQLLRTLNYELNERKIYHQVWLSRRAFRAEPWAFDSDNPRIVVFEIPNSLKSLVTVRYWPNYIRSMWKLFHETRRDSTLEFVQVMPSPFDFLIDIISKYRGLVNIRFVHDFKKHPGDVWPRKRSIKIRVRKASLVVCFSNHVSSYLSTNFHISPIILSLPSKHFSYFSCSSTSNMVSEIILAKSSLPRLLVIGRMREYKGTRLLLEALSIVTEGYDLVVAGEGADGKLLERHGRVYNQWLSENEFIALIRSSDIVIFPYIEATQSGTIPVCISEKKLIVLTDVGGLVEQCGNYSGCFVARPNSKSSLANKIQEAIRAHLEGNQRDLNREKMPSPVMPEVASWVRSRYQL
jgi:glycosyltransferase involved in cell wall biosynthesis